ncbi:hypothetical protein GYMLUDRAFT_73504 [Collybiopsis luxurians FD-317 M1]|uniref:F-box domain-containing protein n=1 Tax=Collybiopsis luxurians FD-317 M1 TaxID=944289 RepID=A0A0D0BZ14_9AGAR|nr:hypothetical protein GYMLUDRAFT_73504 [Collybiopsis luxurians FD-317 M1]
MPVTESPSSSPRSPPNVLSAFRTQLPLEIWFLIVQFIPRHLLQNLMSVNRAFLYAVMAERYKEVSFYQMGEQMMSMVQRLQVPLVRDCVRVLRLRPYFIQELIPGPALAGDACGHDSSLSYSHTQTTEVPDVLSSIRRTLVSLPGLIEYHLVWFELPFLGDIPIDILRAPMIGSGGRHLRKVFLMASLDKLDGLLCAGSSSLVLELPQLEELIISVKRDGGSRAQNLCDTFTNGSGTGDSTRFSSLSSFLIHHRTSLRRFSFSSSHALDCSLLFQSLWGYSFPLLNELFLSIPTPTPHLGDPSSLACWMTIRHLPSLKTLSLKPHFVDDGAAWEESFQKWVKGFVRARQSHLDAGNDSTIQSLKISTGFHSASIYRLVRHFSRGLTSLDLTGRHMTFLEVANLLESLTLEGHGSRRAAYLHTFCLGPVTLSPELVDMLAEKLPHLRELVLHIQNAVPSRNTTSVYSLPAHDGSGTSSRKMRRIQSPAQVKEFFEVMERRTYPEWKEMKRVEVWKFNAKLQYQPKFVELLEGCIPGLAKKKDEVVEA